MSSTTAFRRVWRLLRLYLSTAATGTDGSRWALERSPRCAAMRIACIKFSICAKS